MTAPLQPHVDEAYDLDEITLDISHIETENNEPVDNIFSEKQQRLLTEPLHSSWNGPGDERPFVAMANVGVFYLLNGPPLVPDMFLTMDVKLPEDIWEKRHRSYFVWEYGKPPDVVIEIVSNNKGGEQGRRRRGYEWMRVTNYVIFDPAQQLSATKLQVYELRNTTYVPYPEVWLPAVNLGLTLWTGTYEDREAEWLRWCYEDGSLVPTGAERARQAEAQAEQERERAEQERERAEQERERAEQERERAAQAQSRAELLAAQLRALGIEPEE